MATVRLVIPLIDDAFQTGEHNYKFTNLNLPNPSAIQELRFHAHFHRVTSTNGSGLSGPGYWDCRLLCNKDDYDGTSYINVTTHDKDVNYLLSAHTGENTIPNDLADLHGFYFRATYYRAYNLGSNAYIASARLEVQYNLENNFLTLPTGTIITASDLNAWRTNVGLTTNATTTINRSSWQEVADKIKYSASIADWDSIDSITRFMWNNSVVTNNNVIFDTTKPLLTNRNALVTNISDKVIILFDDLSGSTPIVPINKYAWRNGAWQEVFYPYEAPT